MNNKHLVNIALQHIKDDNPHGIDDIKKGIYNDIDGIHADLNTVKTDVLQVNSKSDSIQGFLDSVKSEVDNLPSVIEARGRLAEEVSRSLIDGKVNQESAIRISQVLNSLNEAKGYTDKAQIGTEEYINSIKTEVIDYSDTLLYHFEEALGPLAFEDKIELARLGETIIDGGYLKTELIKAHSIGASHINTNELVVGDNIMMGENAVIGWNNVGDKPWIPQNADDVGAKPDDWIPTWSEIDGKPEILSAGDITGTIITKDWIGTLGLMVGSEIQMGPNAVITWDNLSEDSRENLKGEDGSDGAQGPQGPQGPKGDTPSDEYITSITKNTITTSYINALDITAKNLTGGTINSSTFNSSYSGYNSVIGSYQGSMKLAVDSLAFSEAQTRPFGTYRDYLWETTLKNESLSYYYERSGIGGGRLTFDFDGLNWDVAEGGNNGTSFKGGLRKLSNSTEPDLELYNIIGNINLTSNLVNISGDVTAQGSITSSNYTASTGSLNLKPDNGSGVGNVYTFAHISPSNGHNLGGATTANRWGNVYIKTGAINESSDVRLKNNITDIPKDLLRFFANEVKPKMFEVNGKTHFGYIAQDVERALYKYAVNKVGLENAQEYVDDFKLLGRDESYLSLVYNQVAVLKEAEIQEKMKEFERRLNEMEEVKL